MLELYTGLKGEFTIAGVDSVEDSARTSSGRMWSLYNGKNTLQAAPILAYMFRANIQNENTKEIILQALISMGMTEVSQYLGVTIEVDASGIGQYADSFFALLGTYHGAGPAYLLAQHRSLFGGRVIRKVQVWSKGYSWRTDSSSGDIDFFIPAQYSLSLRCRATAKLLDEKN